MHVKFAMILFIILNAMNVISYYIRTLKSYETQEPTQLYFSLYFQTVGEKNRSSSQSSNIKIHRNSRPWAGNIVTSRKEQLSE